MEMASKVAVLAVIRAARPVFRSAHDRVAFAVHASFLAAGYSPMAVGAAAASSSPSASGSPPSEENEVGIQGWNGLEGAYAFQYSGGNQSGLCKSLIVKCTVMGDLLMVDASALPDADSPTNLEVKVTDYAVDSTATNYAEQYSDLDELVQLVNSSLISKVSPSAPTTTSDNTRAPAASGQNTREREARQPRISTLEDPPRSSGFGYPEVPVYGGDDLLPGPGAGIFAPRRDIGVGGGSMIVGPGDPRWGRIGVGPQPGTIPGGPNPPGVPPGARFDPFGPPGVPGFEPNRFIRDPRRPPGGHPDLEHFSPF